MPVILDQAIRKFRRTIGKSAYAARLGDGTGVIDEPGQHGYRRVRPLVGADTDGLTSAGYQIVKNWGVRSSNYPVYDGVLVWIDTDVDGKDCIIGSDTAGLIEQNINPGVLNAADPRVYSYGSTQSFLPLLPHAIATGTTATTKITVRDWIYIDSDNQLQRFAGAQIELSSYIPSAGNHGMTLVFLKPDRTLAAQSSTAQSQLIPLDPTTHIQECLDTIDADSIPVSVWQLADGQTTITDDALFLDCRQRINYPASTALPTLPNPVDYPAVIPAGREVFWHTSLEITGSLEIIGTGGSL